MRTTAKPNKTMNVPHAPEKTKELLLLAAKVLFSKQGYHATSVKELADHAGVNVSLVSYHFGGKEGLYRTCLDQFGRSRLDAAERVLIKPKSSEELKVRLQMFMTELIECFVEEPELTRIINRECELESPIVEDVFSKTFMKVYETLVEFFRASQKEGLIRKQIDPQTMTTFLFGALSNFARTDGLSRKYFNKSIADEKYRKKVSEDIYDLFIRGLMA